MACVRAGEHPSRARLVFVFRSLDHHPRQPALRGSEPTYAAPTAGSATAATNRATLLGGDAARHRKERQDGSGGVFSLSLSLRRIPSTSLSARSSNNESDRITRTPCRLPIVGGSVASWVATASCVRKRCPSPSVVYSRLVRFVGPMGGLCTCAHAPAPAGCRRRFRGRRRADREAARPVRRRDGRPRLPTSTPAMLHPLESGDAREPAHGVRPRLDLLQIPYVIP